MPTGEIELTFAPSSTPLSASIDTVAGWPTLIEPMSDSLSATVIVIVSVLISSANPELLDELELDEEPRLAAAIAPMPLPPELDELDDELLLELLAPLVVIESPGDTLASDAIVPLVGACSLVLLSAVSALLTFASALSTDACADAIAAGDGVVECVVVVGVVVVPAAPVPELDAAPVPVRDPELVRVGVWVAGVVTVTVTTLTPADAEPLPGVVLVEVVPVWVVWVGVVRPGVVVVFAGVAFAGVVFAGVVGVGVVGVVVVGVVVAGAVVAVGVDVVPVVVGV